MKKKTFLRKLFSESKDFIVSYKNLIFRATGKPLKPRWIVWEITDACNSRCSHCSIWKQKPTADQLTLEETKRAFKDKLFSGIESILITGGEPVLRADLADIILAINKILPRAKMDISTNALLPDRVLKVVEIAAENNVPIGVGISIDGIGEKHDKIRGVRGNFERVNYLIKELKKLNQKYKGKISINLGITLSDLTVDSFKEVCDYAKKLNLNLLAQPYNEASYYHNVGTHLVKTDKMLKIVRSLPESPHRKLWLRALKKKSIKFPCFALNTFFLLKCNGDIKPCLSLDYIPAGNIKKSSPSKVWRSMHSRKAREMVKACKGCLNDWGVGMSIRSSYPFSWFLFKAKKGLKLSSQ